MGNTLGGYKIVDHELSIPSKGTIKGVQYDNKARRYAGIPYALPPTGDHRWRKPRPLPSSYTYMQPDASPLDASEFRAVCPQATFHSGAEKGLGPEQYSEDCLILNIWTPVSSHQQENQRKWPVMLWLHGGWFQMGDPCQELGMDPTEMISTGKLNAIVVGIGYRLNIFGFLAGEAFLQESNGECAGNMGLWDQRLAMEWVKEHISAFGGDPENITLAGRSAGAYAVHAQTLYDFRTENSQRLYSRIFMCSNAIPAQPKTVAETEPQFDEVCNYFKLPVTLTGPEKLAQLRKISSDELVGAINNLQHHTFRPVTDGIFIHAGMMDFQRSSEFAEEFKRRNLKLLIGEVLNEETLYSTYNAPEPNRKSLGLQVSNYYAPATTERILEYYALPKSSDPDEWRTTYGNIIADGQVRAPSRSVANSLFKHGVAIDDIWRYQIAYRLSFINEKVAPLSFGVAHAMDKPLWK